MRISPGVKSSGVLLLTLWMAAPDLAGAETPKFKHAAVTAVKGRDVTFRAEITSKGGVMEPHVVWRISGATWNKLPMKERAAPTFEAVLPTRELSGAEAFEYFLQAFDGEELAEGTWRSAGAPQLVRVRAPEAMVHKVTLRTTTSALLFVDGVTVGSTPYTAPLSPGRHVIALSASGFERFEQELVMPADRDLTLDLVLTPVGAEPQTVLIPVPAPAPEPAAPPPPVATAVATRIRIHTVPSGALITVDGHAKGPSPVELDVTPGPHEVGAKHAGRVQGRAEVVAVEGSLVEKTLQLPPTDLVSGPPESGSGFFSSVSPRSWILGGAAIGAIAVAAGLGWQSASLRSGDSTSDVGGVAVHTITQADAAGSNTYALGADVCFGIAGALGAAAAVSFAFE